LITREVYVVDVSKPEAGFIDERRAHAQIDDLLRVASRGSAVRLVVGNVPPMFGASELMRPAAYWVQLVTDHAVQIEGEVRAVRAWMAALEGRAA